MTTKTISIEIDVYEQLKALKATPSESFSQVLRRQLPVARGLPAYELLRRSKQKKGFLGISEPDLRRIETARKDHYSHSPIPPSQRVTRNP